MTRGVAASRWEGRQFTMVVRHELEMQGAQLWTIGTLSPTGKTKASMTPILRPSGPGDQEFLFQLYASTREAEFATLGWDRARLDALLRMQFSAQQRWYETAFPSAERHIVMLGDACVGRVMVHRGAEAATLVDIALLPQHRGQGIGNALIQDLIEQCARKGLSLRLQVLKTNPAARLYARLGFVKTGEDGMYLQMEKRPV